MNSKATSSKKGKKKQSLLSGVVTALVIGTASYYGTKYLNQPILDPLLVALFLGFILKFFVRSGESDDQQGLHIATKILIPIGIVFYAAKNLNFTKIAEMPSDSYILTIIVLVATLFISLVIGALFKLKKETLFLTATGSSVCGSSAIAITAPSVKANARQITSALVGVVIAGFITMILTVPVFGLIMDIDNGVLATFAGAVLPLTGLVKATMQDFTFFARSMPLSEVSSLALSVKALKFPALIILIPIFSSMVRRRLSLPLALWLYVGAGILGTYLFNSMQQDYTENYLPWISKGYGIAWAAAMASIGLGTDFRNVFKNDGALNTFLTSFFALTVATLFFFIGLAIFS